MLRLTHSRRYPPETLFLAPKDVLRVRPLSPGIQGPGLDSHAFCANLSARYSRTDDGKQMIFGMRPLARAGAASGRRFLHDKPCRIVIACGNFEVRVFRTCWSDICAS